MRRLMGRLLAAGLAASPALAAPLRTADVADSASWVVHLDMPRVTATRMWSLSRAESNGMSVVRNLAAFQSAFGVDPAKDLDSVTMYDSDYTQGEGVAILRGRITAAAVQPYLSRNPGRQSVAFGSRKIHFWTDAAKARAWALCIPAPGIAVVSSSPDKVKSALRVLDRTAPALNTKRMRLPGLSSAVVVAADRINGQVGNAATSALLQNADWLTLTADEAAGNVAMALTLGVGTPEDAARVEQAFHAMTALMTLSQQSPAAADMANAITVSTAGSVVSAKLVYPAAALHQLLKAKRGAGPTAF